MDFYKISERSTTRGRNNEVVAIDIYPDFIVKRSSDLMIRGKSFYAVWDKNKGLWSKDEYDVVDLVDKELYDYKEALQKNTKLADIPIKVMAMASNRSKTWKEYKQYTSTLADNYHELDEKLTFLNTDVKKEDYVSRRLGYSLEEGDCTAWDRLVGTLYDPGEREKIEWSIGAIISGDSRTIQKFAVFYGAAGTGKSTIINIIQKLFNGYYITFDARALATPNSQFSTEVFRSNPLVAIQHDGDLSRIEDNTKINSIVSHEQMVINEKGKPQYMMRMNCFLFLGTNKPVKITDARSGIIRRLIDITPSGRKLAPKEYESLMNQIDFELGPIAQHCLDVYSELGKNYYKNYIPRDMILKTDVFYNFVEACIDVFESQDGMTLKQAYGMYKDYCDDALVEFKLPRHKFREELKVYYNNFEEVARIDGKQVRSWYSGFKREKMEIQELHRDIQQSVGLVFDATESILDEILSECPAQYATEDENEKPLTSWNNCKTKLKDIDTHRVHYILPRFQKGSVEISSSQEPNLIMIDFDIKNENGEKDARLNLEAAAKWPETYGEFSKGGAGVHLIYWYTGDILKLAATYAPGIEIKPFPGNSSMRRRLSYCHNATVATLHEGSLPVKEEKMIDTHVLKDQKHLINKIKRALRKEDNVGGTRCEIDLIKKTLDDAFESGMSYNVSDMEHDILMLAMSSSNQKDYCVDQVKRMKFKSEDEKALEVTLSKSDINANLPLVYYDVEIYPPGIDDDGEDNEGLFLVCWKIEGEGQEVHVMVNPKPHEVEAFVEMQIGGFNNFGYDDHLLYARIIGYSNAQLYDLSHRLIVENAPNAKFREARNISKFDVFDYCSVKQGLKRWEIDLDIDHMEMAIPWDKPAPKRMWPLIIEYCSNDVRATEKVAEARREDFKAREIQADIAGGEIRDSTNALSTMFIFGKDRHPKLVYTDLRTGEQFGGHSPEGTINSFPEYSFEWGDDGKRHNMYRGVDVGKGGYVYSKPGIWLNVALLDIQSMHPNSIVNLNLFGEYTERFKQLLDARIAIKNKDFDTARKMFDGKLAKYLTDETDEEGIAALAQALKIVINSVYGLTSASFDNPFRDPRNENNIVALRGALFMKTLQDEVTARGFTVAHIKTDSIKIPDATPEIIEFCMEFARKYGYIFEHEATYERMCLLDKAQYVAAYMNVQECEARYGYVPKDNRKQFKKHNHPWTTTGDAFQHPYIFKTLFSGEPIEFKDRCETKTVRGAAIYLDKNEGYPDVTAYEKAFEKLLKQSGCDRTTLADALDNKVLPKELDEKIRQNLENIAKGHNYIFVGRAGSFFPVRPGVDGGWMVSLRNGKYGSVNGAKGFRWLESNFVKNASMQDEYDPRYFKDLIDKAIESVTELNGVYDPSRFDRFIDLSRPYEELPKDEVKEEDSVEPDQAPHSPTLSAAAMDVPWIVPCGDSKYNTCMECPHCHEDICDKGYSLATFDDELPF